MERWDRHGCGCEEIGSDVRGGGAGEGLWEDGRD